MIFLLTFFISAEAFWLFFDYVLSKVINTSRVQMLKEKKPRKWWSLIVSGVLCVTLKLPKIKIFVGVIVIQIFTRWRWNRKWTQRLDVVGNVMIKVFKVPNVVKEK